MTKEASRRRRRAFAHERSLIRLLWKKGFACIRAPASGSKVKRTVYPDVVAIWKGRTLVFEVKTSERRRTIYIPREQVEKIKEFATRAGGQAFIAIKIVGRGEPWRFIPVEELEHTSSGNFKVSLDSLERALTIRDLEKIVGMTHGLEDFIGGDM